MARERFDIFSQENPPYGKVVVVNVATLCKRCSEVKKSSWRTLSEIESETGYCRGRIEEILTRTLGSQPQDVTEAGTLLVNMCQLCFDTPGDDKAILKEHQAIEKIASIQEAPSNLW